LAELVVNTYILFNLCIVNWLTDTCDTTLPEHGNYAETCGRKVIVTYTYFLVPTEFARSKLYIIIIIITIVITFLRGIYN
jgi:hypothetical protein